MPSLKDIRSRIESTKNTQQITKAMKLVSASKLRKAQQNIINMRPYAQSLLQVIADIALTKRVNHPLLAKPEGVKKVLLVVLTSDRGLCGAFNANINNFALKYYNENKPKFEKLDFLFIGRRAADFFARKQIKPIDLITKLDRDVCYPMAASVADRLMNDYLDGHYDEIRIIYNEFKSAISQQVISETLLPVDISKTAFKEQDEKSTASFAVDMIFEPKIEKIIDQLLIKHFSMQVFRCMSESVAAEHGARMTAMENATNNARDMMENLTLTYNKLRQASITRELIEITTGAEALNG